MINVDFTSFTTFIGSDKPFKALDINNRYYLFAYDGTFQITCQVEKDGGNDQTNYESNYAGRANGTIQRKNSNQGLVVDTSNSLGLPGASSITVNTHDFGDRTTWYQKSVQVTQETLTDSGDGLTFNSANANWINMDNLRLTYDYKMVPERDGSYTDRSNRRPLVYVDSTLITDPSVPVPQVTAYTVDYVNGKITFPSSQSGHTIQVTYWHNNNVARRSEWILNPPAGTSYLLDYIEFQFSKTTVFGTPIHIEIWAGADVGTYSDFNYALYDAGYGQNRSIYRGPIDFLNICTNRSSQIIPAYGGLTNDVLIFPFDYLIQSALRSDQGVVVMFALEGDTPYASSEVCTGTFYMQIVPLSSL